MYVCLSFFPRRLVACLLFSQRVPFFRDHEDQRHLPQHQSLYSCPPFQGSQNGHGHRRLCFRARSERCRREGGIPPLHSYHIGPGQGLLRPARQNLPLGHCLQISLQVRHFTKIQSTLHYPYIIHF